MKSVIRNVGLALAASGLLLLPCEAQVNFQLYATGTSDTAATRNPGDIFSLSLVAVSITGSALTLGNLDSFTYRIIFPNELFTLTGNTFAAPFDNAQVPGGFNGSIPWSGLPLIITFNVDAGSPGATAFVPDIYRTTATQAGTPVAGPNALLETLTLRVPSPSVPTLYPIRLDVLEAADANGALHTVFSGVDFNLMVVPEPTTTTLVAISLAGCLAWRALRGRKHKR